MTPALNKKKTAPRPAAHKKRSAQREAPRRSARRSRTAVFNGNFVLQLPEGWRRQAVGFGCRAPAVGPCASFVAASDTEG